MNSLQSVLDELKHLFKNSASKKEAHASAKRLMEQVSRDRNFLRELLTRHLKTPEIYNRGHYPVVALDVSVNAEFTLSVNCWIPYENSRTDIATKPIHHHGELLLTTANIFGPGYQHLIFNTPKLIDEESELYSLELKESIQHTLHQVAFVDVWEPHLPLYPKDLSITLALWSHSENTSWKDHLKHISVVRRNERMLRELVNFSGMSKQFHLKAACYYDFYPLKNGGFRGAPEKVEHIRGPNTDHLRSLMHVVQCTGNESLAPIIRSVLESGRVSRPETLKGLLRDLENEHPIPAFVSDVHVGVPYLSFCESDILNSIRQKPVGNTPYAS